MLKLGEKIISDIYLGDKKIAKVFWGDKLVYQAGKPIFLDYISFDGESWIDVDYIPSSNTRVVGKVSFTQWHPNAGANYIFGVFGGNANFGLNVGAVRTVMNVPWGSISGVAFNNNTTLGQVYSFDISKNGAYLDGVLKLQASQFTQEFTATKSFFVGWSNGTGTNKLVGNIYPMQMYENDVLVKDLRPCLDANGVVCLYDMVTKKYHYNIGTGTLTAGNVIKFVDYVITDGSSYIDTEFYPSANTYIEYTFEVPRKPTGNFNGLFGSRQNTTYYPYNVFATKAQTFRIDYGKYDETGHLFDLNTKYTMRAGNGEVYINDKLVKSYTVAYKGTSPYSMYLGNFNNAGTPYTIGTPQKIYPCPIYENGVLVRDLKPCVVAGEACFYDMVTGNLFYNQGTGKLGYMEK